LHAPQEVLRQAHLVEDFPELPRPSADIMREACTALVDDWVNQGMLSTAQLAGVIC